MTTSSTAAANTAARAGQFTPKALDPQILGQAEKAHAPVLQRILAGTGLSMNQWVAVKFTALAGGSAVPDQLAGQVAGALRIDADAALAALDALTAAGLLEPSAKDPSRLEFTDAGQDVHDRIAAGVQQVLSRAYAGIPAEDLLTAGRVLTLITERLNATPEPTA